MRSMVAAVGYARPDSQRYTTLLRYPSRRANAAWLRRPRSARISSHASCSWWIDIGPFCTFLLSRCRAYVQNGPCGGEPPRLHVRVAAMSNGTRSCALLGVVLLLSCSGGQSGDEGESLTDAASPPGDGGS